MPSSAGPVTTLCSCPTRLSSHLPRAVVAALRRRRAADQADQPRAGVLHAGARRPGRPEVPAREVPAVLADALLREEHRPAAGQLEDRKSTRLNSSHLGISYAVFCWPRYHSLLLPYTTLFPSPSSCRRPSASPPRC